VLRPPLLGSFSAREREDCTVVFALFSVLGPLLVAVVIIASYRASVRRNQASWNESVEVVTPPTGAYRDGERRIGFVERVRQIPPRVQTAAIVALVFGVMWLPSLPLVGLGVAVEADDGPGLATFFGIPGIALSIAHFVLGLRITKRSASARRFARVVGTWSIVHNVLLLGVTFWTNMMSRTLSAPFRMCRMSEGGGVVVVLYALASIAYAVFAMVAVRPDPTYADEGDLLWPPTDATSAATLTETPHA